MTASGDFLSKDLFCQPQQQPYLLISRPLKDVFQSFSCLFHCFLPFSTKTPFIFRSYFRLEPSRKYAYTVNIHFNLYCKEVCPSMQRRFFRSMALLSVFLLLIFFPVFAHPGRTDSSGGHYDRSSGTYHYHHGYPAHQHIDLDGDGTLDCPYKFDDQTSHSGSSSGLDALVESIKKQKSKSDPEPTTFRDILSVAIEIVLLTWWIPFLVYYGVCEHRRKRRK